MNEHTEILIEKSLQGALSAAESAELSRILDDDPEARRCLEELRRAEEALDRHAEEGLEKIDWNRMKRVRRSLELHHLVAPIAAVLFTAWAATTVLQVEPLWRKLAYGAGTLLVALWASNVLVERARNRRLFDWLDGGDGPFMDRYRIVVEREWKKHRSGWAGAVLAVVFLLILAAVGNRPAPCLVAAGLFLLIETYKHLVVVRPLRREREELRS